ncbi:mCG1047693, partial [Mus musculus]
ITVLKTTVIPRATQVWKLEVHEQVARGAEFLMSIRWSTPFLPHNESRQLYNPVQPETHGNHSSSVLKYLNYRPISLYNAFITTLISSQRFHRHGLI